MTTDKSEAPAAVTARASVSNPTSREEKENTIMTHTDQPTECKHCTVPTDCGDTCTFCRMYTPPGIEVATDWNETDNEYRIIHGETVEVPADDRDPLLVTPYITQLRDGTFSVDEEHDKPLIFVDELRNDRPATGPYAQERLTITRETARELAAALIDAADELDGWINR